MRRRADYLRHVVAEIDNAKLKPGEDEALQIEARRLSQAGALAEQAQRIADALERDEENALGALCVADRALTSLEKADPSTAAWREMLDAAYANLAELARLAAEYAEEIQEDPERLAEVERRRDLLFRLTGKYGATARGGARHSRASRPASWTCWTRRTWTFGPSPRGVRPRKALSGRRRRRSPPGARGVGPAGARGQPAAPAARDAGREAPVVL